MTKLNHQTLERTIPADVIEPEKIHLRGITREQFIESLAGQESEERRKSAGRVFGIVKDLHKTGHKDRLKKWAEVGLLIFPALAQESEAKGDLKQASQDLNRAGDMATWLDKDGEAYVHYANGAELAVRCGQSVLASTQHSAAGGRALRLGRLEEAYRHRDMAAALAEQAIPSLQERGAGEMTRIQAAYNRVFAGETAMRLAYGIPGNVDRTWREKSVKQLHQAREHIQTLVRGGVDVRTLSGIFTQRVGEVARLFDPQIEQGLSLQGLQPRDRVRH